ncbi:prephenate dehydrogenase/arogenate dehydrogenase family protein [Candidatus Microgenomates bacterium]|nr:prephenate dehydrogenase/arogenate dehydrogenase family protein [Candidatus Microgenomates bacterium]
MASIASKTCTPKQTLPGASEDNQDKPIIGIIGLGSFGLFVHSLVPPGAKVTSYDKNRQIQRRASKMGIKVAGLREVAAADIVVLGVPLNSYAQLLQQIKPILRPQSLLVDVCSIKVLSERLIRRHLPKHRNLLITHPLFGPQSAAKTTRGHVLMVTNKSGRMAQLVLDYCRRDLGLKIQSLNAWQHDRIMANVHALTLVIARALSDMKIETGPFITPSYKMLIDLIEFNSQHTQELFETIQLGNPFASAVRRRLVNSLGRIEKNLSKKGLF